MRYYLYAAKGQGPFLKEQLAQFNLSEQDLVKEEGADYWIEACKIPDLQDLFAPAETVADGEPVAGSSVEDGTETEDAYIVSDDGQNANSKQAEPAEAEEVAEAEVLPVSVTPKPAARPLKDRIPFLVAMGVLAFVLMLMAFNPNKKAHEPAVVKMVETTMDLDQRHRTPFDDFFNDPFFDMFFGNSSASRQRQAENILNDIEYNNAFLFSYTSVKNGKDTKWLTFGIFGHVFTLNQDALNQHVFGPSVSDDDEQEQREERRQSPAPKKREKKAPVPDDAVTL